MEEREKIQHSERSRYRSSFSATLLFSGVQLYQILIKIVKSKFVALFIGPAGMGVQSLLYSTTDTISAATNLGLNTSSVKTIAAANRDGNRDLIARNVTAQRRLIWITGLLGMVFCAALAPLWSQTSFGNSDYVFAFVIVSVIVLFDQQLARANLIGQSLNALITIPLYYFYGLKAIVAALVLGSLISLVISLCFSRRLGIKKVKMSWRETYSVGREMIKLGFFLSLQSAFSMLVLWIIRNYVSQVGGVEDVGLYSAGTAIVGTYLGLVFTAMTTDYFPRLAATKSNTEMNDAVRTQAEITILLLAPLAVAFVVFCKPVIKLLYSDKFLPIEYMMYWSIGAVLFQAMGWAVSYTLLAKAKPSVFFTNEVVSIAWGLPIKLICYKYWGLTGFGMATLIVYALYLLQVLVVTNKIYEVSYLWQQWKLFLLLNIPILITVILKLIMTETWGYILGGFVFVLTGIFVLKLLDKKLDLKVYLQNRLKK